MGLNYPNSSSSGFPGSMGGYHSGLNPMGGNVKPVQATDQMATNIGKAANSAVLFEQSLQRSLKIVKDLTASWQKVSGNNNLSPLLNDSTNSENNSVLSRLTGGISSTLGRLRGEDPSSQSQQTIAKMQQDINAQIPIPKATATRIGSGISAVASMAASMMPYTNDAVTQRMLTQGVGSMIGMDPNKITAMSNKLLAGGITGAYSAQAATSILASQGILPTMGSFSNIMQSTGGLSVLTGMSNEQTAQAFGSINSMNFLRVGVRARDAKGQLRAPEDIANDLYRRLYGNRKLTEAQSAQIFNQNSKGYQGIMAVAGGNADLAAQLQEMLYYQGKGGGTKLNVKDAENVKNNILNLRKDDPSRAQWNYQGSEANKLQATSNGLVGGYSAALDATASVNNGMAGLANMLPQVTNAFGNLKGFLDTLPTAGGTGATMFGGMGMGIGHFGSMLAMNRMAKGLTATEAALTGETALATEAGGGVVAAGGTAALATKLAGGGAISRTLGSGLDGVAAKGGMTLARGGGAALAAGATYYGMSKIQNRLQQYGRDHNLNGNLRAAGNELFNTGKYAATGAVAGAVLGGPVGAAAGAVLGTAFGVGHMALDFATGNWGRGGPNDGHTSQGPDHNTPKSTKSDLPRNARQAASWAIQQAKSGSSGWHDRCEKFVELAWGKAGRYYDAISHWNAASKEGRAHKGKDAPPGALVFWGGGNHGHTAISIGGGKVVSTDILRQGQADIVNIDTITKRWSMKYLGWADPSKNTILNKNATPISAGSNSNVVPTSTPSSQTPNSSEASSPWYQKALSSLTSVFSGHSASSSSSSGASMSIASDAIGVSDAATTSSLLGLGSSSSSDYAGSGINISMTVNIGTTSKVDIQSLARDIRTAIDKEMRNEKIRGY